MLCAQLHHTLIFIRKKKVHLVKTPTGEEMCIFNFMQILGYSHENLSAIGWKT